MKSTSNKLESMKAACLMALKWNSNDELTQELRPLGVVLFL